MDAFQIAAPVQKDIRAALKTGMSFTRFQVGGGKRQVMGDAVIAAHQAQALDMQRLAGQGGIRDFAPSDDIEIRSGQDIAWIDTEAGRSAGDHRQVFETCKQRGVVTQPAQIQAGNRGLAQNGPLGGWQGQVGGEVREVTGKIHIGIEIDADGLSLGTQHQRGAR